MIDAQNSEGHVHLQIQSYRQKRKRALLPRSSSGFTKIARALFGQTIVGISIEMGWNFVPSWYSSVYLWSSRTNGPKERKLPVKKLPKATPTKHFQRE